MWRSALTIGLGEQSRGVSFWCTGPHPAAFSHSCNPGKCPTHSLTSFKISIEFLLLVRKIHIPVVFFMPSCAAFSQPCSASAGGNFSKKNYFTSSDPHHDMLGGGCQVRVVIENMMGRMENLKTLISGFLGLVILVRWALVTMFLS